MKHLEKFPNDSLASILANVYDFDHFAEQNDLKNTFKEVMNKHGIPIGSSSFQMNLAKLFSLPAILPLHKFSLKQLETRTDSSAFGLISIMDLNWKKLASLNETQMNKFKCDRREARVESFSEMRSTWSLENKQQIITDMLTTKCEQTGHDLIYIAGIKPISVIQLDTETNDAKEVNLNSFFSSAWRMYFPRIKLLPVENDGNSVLVYEETTNELFKVDLNANEVLKLEKSLRESNSHAQHLLNAAKKTFNKYFVDQTLTYKMVYLENDKSSSMNNLQFVSYRYNSNQLSFVNLKNNTEVNLNLNFENMIDDLSDVIPKTFKLSVNHVTQLSSNSILVAAFDSNAVANSDNVKISDLRYFILFYPNLDESLHSSDLNSLNKQFKLYLVDKNILGSSDDLLLHQIQLKNINKSDATPGAFKVINKKIFFF